jgi:hypothetical protein
VSRYTYITGAQLDGDGKGTLFRSAVGRTGTLSDRFIRPARNDQVSLYEVERIVI